MVHENSLWNGSQQQQQQQQRSPIHFLRTHLLRISIIVMTLGFSLSLYHFNKERYKISATSEINCIDCRVTEPSDDTILSPSSIDHITDESALTSSESVIKEKEKENQSLNENYVEREKDLYILCAVITVKYHTIETEAVIDTWGHRCDKLIFFTHHEYPFKNPNATIHYYTPSSQSGSISNLPRYYASMKNPTWEFLDFIIQSSLKQISEEIQNQKLPFIVISNTDSFVVIENIKRKIIELNLEKEKKPLFLGHSVGKKQFLSKFDTPSIEGLIINQFAVKSIANEPDNSSSKCMNSDSSNCKPESNGAICFASCLSKLSGTILITAKDVDGKDQIRIAPHYSAKSRKDQQIYTRRPLVFTNAGEISSIKTGYFSYLYFYDYFLYRTGTNGFERLRPLATPDVKLWAQNTYRR